MPCTHSVADYYSLVDPDLGRLLWCICRDCGETVIVDAV